MSQDQHLGRDSKRQGCLYQLRHLGFPTEGVSELPRDSPLLQLQRELQLQLQLLLLFPFNVRAGHRQQMPIPIAGMLPPASGI